MNVKIILDWAPATVIASLLAIPILLVLGWLISIISALMSKKGKALTLFLIFPPTNPFALLVLLWKDWKSGMVPAFCYVLALFAIPLGGAVAESIEKSRLRAYEQELIDSGEKLSVESLIPEPVSVQSNIWTHLYLAPLTVAGQSTKEGEDARSTDRYASMRLPSTDSKIKYTGEGRWIVDSRQSSQKQPLWDLLRDLHRHALSIVSARDGVINESNTPQSWEACGEILVDHFKNAEDDFAQLEEALKRPYDQYPYAWNDGMEMKMPPLSHGWTRT